MKTLTVEATFLEPVLGTLPGNPHQLLEHVLNHCPDELVQEQLEAAPEPDEEMHKLSTFFPRDEYGPLLWDYQVRGNIKSAMLAAILSDEWTAEALKKIGISKWTYKRAVDLLVFVRPRKIRLVTKGEASFLERPIRIEPPKGLPRVALARSEMLPAGTTFSFRLELRNENLEDLVRWCLDYGRYNGLGQWRNGSYGQYEATVM